MRFLVRMACQITLSGMIDADWTIGRERADVAGKILADALLNREQVRSLLHCLVLLVFTTLALVKSTHSI